MNIYYNGNLFAECAFPPLTSDDMETAEYDFSTDTFSLVFNRPKTLWRALDLHFEEYSIGLSARMKKGDIAIKLCAYHIDTNFKPPAHKIFEVELSTEELRALTSIIIRAIGLEAKRILEENSLGEQNGLQLCALGKMGLEF